MCMTIRPLVRADLDQVAEIDATIEAIATLHVERFGEGLDSSWRLALRPLADKFIQSNPLDEETAFTLKQIATGIDEGLALVIEHDGQIIALLLAQPRPANRTLHLLDVRVDYDFRMQGLGSALLYQAIQSARDAGFRAVSAFTLSSNHPAAQFLLKAGFEPAGLDTHRTDNQDLAQQSVTLLWYAPLD